MKKERLVEFLEKYVFGKYKNHLIILDNACSHRNNYVKDAIVGNIHARLIVCIIAHYVSQNIIMKRV